MNNDAYDAALAMQASDDHDSAIPKFEEALTVEPDRARIYSNLALSLLCAGRVDDALEPAQHGCELRDKDDAYPLLKLAAVLWRLDRHVETLAASEQALSVCERASLEQAEAFFYKAWSLIGFERDR